MVHVIFDTNSVSYDDFVQTGAGILAESPVLANQYFRGMPVYSYQRGYGGIGDIFRGLYRFFLPIIRNVGTNITSEALNTGQRVLEQIRQGAPLKETLITEGKKGIDTVLDRSGLPKQFGNGAIALPKRLHLHPRKSAIKGTRKYSSSSDYLNNHYQTLIGNKAITKPLIVSSTPNTRKRRIRADAFGVY